MNKNEIIKAVRAHAIVHYEDGWDVIVECYNDKQIEEAIGSARTIGGALKKIAKIAELRVSIQAEHDQHIRDFIGDEND